MGTTTHWHSTIERTVAGLDYELVDVERSAAGLLRVTIDRIPGHSYPGGDSESVTVDDCERVTRQLQYVLDVDNVPYSRLEVSSPGLDRPLKRPADYERFVGQEVAVTLKVAFQGRKNYRGLLTQVADGWRLELTAPAVERKPARGAGRAKAAAEAAPVTQALDFQIEEVREARLVPAIDFKGRARATPGARTAEETEEMGRALNGGQTR